MNQYLDRISNWITSLLRSRSDREIDFYFLLIVVFLVFILPYAGWYFSLNPVLTGMLSLIPVFLLLSITIMIFNKKRERYTLSLACQTENLAGIQFDDFEILVGGLLELEGYKVEDNSRGMGPDGGIDLIARKDGKKILVQCKHHGAKPIPPKPIRELYGVMLMKKHRANGAIFVTSGIYSEKAKEEFEDVAGIELWDKSHLQEIIQRHQESIERDGELKSVSEKLLDFIEIFQGGRGQHTIKVPKCSKCKKLMVLKQNAETKAYFWGCSEYRSCGGKSVPIEQNDIPILDYRRGR